MGFSSALQAAFTLPAVTNRPYSFHLASEADAVAFVPTWLN